MSPVTEYAQALEALALQVEVLNGKLVAHLADLGRGGGVELLGAERLFNLVLDGLTVAVPSQERKAFDSPAWPSSA